MQPARATSWLALPCSLEGALKLASHHMCIPSPAVPLSSLPMQEQCAG